MTDEAIQVYLASLPTEFQGVVMRLHAIARKQMRGAHAMVYHGALGYATSGSPFDRIVYIAPQRSWVNLGFFFGADLPDPYKLLEGEGVLLRHIKIRTEMEGKNPAIAKLL